ncbi:uncharacterized protein LOC130763628 [Actinidia eriantha]|uniref:uncharacterized protein LOC130763628 n=1 Tax=Actinidia eriantha TaxID=165200 RepID=UPI00258E35C7|nr:uncharacterized protein LOC130763628 [Actinidia eriantha]
MAQDLTSLLQAFALVLFLLVPEMLFVVLYQSTKKSTFFFYFSLSCVCNCLQMAHQRDYLVKVGREGFDILDSYFGRKGKPIGPQQQQQNKKPHAYEGFQVPPMKHRVIDCYEAVIVSEKRFVRFNY